MKIPENINRTDIIIAMQEWVIGQNAERNRKILARRLIDGIGFEKLEEEFGLTERQIKNIVYKYNNIIFKHIHK